MCCGPYRTRHAPHALRPVASFRHHLFRRVLCTGPNHEGTEERWYIKALRKVSLGVVVWRYLVPVHSLRSPLTRVEQTVGWSLCWCCVSEHGGRLHPQNQGEQYCARYGGVRQGVLLLHVCAHLHRRRQRDGDQGRLVVGSAFCNTVGCCSFASLILHAMHNALFVIEMEGRYV